MTSPVRIAWIVATVLLASVVASGCLKRELKELNPCLVSGVVAEIAVTNIDKVDLLFVVDDSQSMREEQVALRREFPRLIDVLTSGDLDGDNMADFSPAKDLHLGVVSTDMGLVGIQGVPGCMGLGQDGIMNTVPGPDVSPCESSYPPFLSYDAEFDDQNKIVQDFACIASLGTEGCGFEQQLEAGLKALWPSIDPMPDQNGENRIKFLGDANGFGQLGHGDAENAGFLRNDPVEGLSLIAIIVVSDEEDCSSANTAHFTPMQFLDPNSELAMQDLNLRCYYNPGNLYSVDRYYNGFRALRPGNENLVIFGAIVGVPPELVSEDRREGIDFSDPQMVNAYYDNILADPNMQERPDETRPPGAGNLVPSCQTENGTAFPPRRFVEVARRFGENGVIQSICQDNFQPAMDAIIEVIAKQLGAVCLPRPLVRNSDGTVGCKVVWELPRSGTAQSGTPTTCDERPYLEAPEGRAVVGARGGQVCEVRQLPVLTETEPTGMGEGWFYDDFSQEVQDQCSGSSRQRVSFTPDAKPPTGVTVKLECLNETQSLADNRTNVMPDQPTIGDPCDERQLPNGDVISGDAACVVRLAGGETDDSLICHPELNVCVQQCSTDADCPAAWVCDSRPETLEATTSDARPNGTPICVNPTCGDI